MTQAYAALESRFTKMYRLGGAAAILGWDAATMMPDNSNSPRSNTLATLEGLAHEMLIAPEMKQLISAAEKNSAKLNLWQQANLKLMRRQWLHATAVDPSLIEKLVIASNHCEHAWRTLRKDNNFKEFLPLQHKVLGLVREVAKQKASAFKCSRYDALLDTYDPGQTSKRIDALFADLKKFLPGFLDDVLAHQEKKPAIQPLKGTFPAATQKKVGTRFMEALGFDFTRGRLDISHHPFCGGVYGDVRITTRYNERDFTSALMGVLHETGHALYEFGLPEKYYEQPVGQALGMSIHESQSLLVEMQVCRSQHFLKYAAPILKKAFGGTGSAWSTDNLYRIYTQVKPGLIRVDADEVTYPAHVILRYEMEKLLVEGDMEFKDVPAAWKKQIKALLGVTVPNDKDGCMQDVHWPSGSFGYFPTYTLGAMNAAQLFAAAKKQSKTIVPGIEKGNFKPLVAWLQANVHSQGARLTADELIKQATGKTLDAEVYKTHLKNRYLA
jgi:carboxypeptidase Taq